MFKKIFICTFFVSVLCLNLFAKNNNFEISYETSSYTYKEPHLSHPISLKSNKQGLSLSYRKYNIWQSTLPDTNFAQLEARYMTGYNTYKGWMQSGGIYIPYESSGIKDYYFETALKAGRLLYSKDNLYLEGSVGLAFRYLKDNLQNIGEGGYLRKSTYIYLPIEAGVNYKFSNDFNLTLKTEFDWLLSGRQYSGSIVDYSYSSAVYNDQEEGYGLRASLKLAYNSHSFNFFIEPFWRYWHIQNSEDEIRYINIGGSMYQQITYEPSNTTQEYGIKIGIKF